MLAWAGCGSAVTGDGGTNPGADLSVIVDMVPEGYCAVDRDCTRDPAKAYCEVGSHTCVGCLKDDNCPNGSLCAVGTHTCSMGCSAGHNCASDGGVCETDAGVCVQCITDNDCAGNPMKSRCDSVQHSCFECNPAKDNCGYGLFCAQDAMTMAFTCQPGCKIDDDCRPMGGGGADGGAADGGAGDGGMPAGGPIYCDAPKHTCVQCTADANCPLGQLCKADTCVPGCSGMHGCNGQLACCGMAGAQLCTDTKTDFSNCGACGMVCQGGWNCCNSGCTNPVNDIANCGTCGTTCAVANGTPACTQRICTIAACDQGWKDCNANYMDGCETHTDINVNNCGACNMVCNLDHTAQQKCIGGVCKVGSCAAGWADCDGNPANGCETNVAQDANNCNACGKKCSSNNIAQVSCGPVMGMTQCNGNCNMGFLDCNLDKLTDGCEINGQTDVNNCGKCGTSCAASCVGNVMMGAGNTTCTNGACAVAANGCGAGFYDLNATCADGCECQSTPSVAQVCNMAQVVPAVAIGGKQTFTYNMVPNSGIKEGWFKVTFSGDPHSGAYHPLIQLASAVPSAYQMDIYGPDCVKLPLLTCGKEMNTSVNITTQWEVQWTSNVVGAVGGPCSDFTQASCMPFAAPGGGSVYVRVYRNLVVPTGTKCTDQNYVLTITS